MCVDCKNLLILFAISRSAFFGRDSKMFKEKSMLRRGKKRKIAFCPLALSIVISQLYMSVIYSSDVVQLRNFNHLKKMYIDQNLFELNENNNGYCVNYNFVKL